MIWNAGAERAPRATLQALQLERLRTAVAWACERVAFYRGALAEAGIEPSDLDHVNASAGGLVEATVSGAAS